MRLALSWSIYLSLAPPLNTATGGENQAFNTWAFVGHFVSKPQYTWKLYNTVYICQIDSVGFTVHFTQVSLGASEKAIWKWILHHVLELVRGGREGAVGMEGRTAA
jgi:hypothetical protein